MPHGVDEGLPPTVRIVVRKGVRRLCLYHDERLLSEHAVVIGRNGAADKRMEGDLATPLGDFFVCAKNPRSRFYLSLCVSYPNREDADRGLEAGLIDAAEHAQIHQAIRLRKMPPQHTRLGGEIYIHGQSPSGPVDATRGCIALDNSAMKMIYEAASLGTSLRIEP